MKGLCRLEDNFLKDSINNQIPIKKSFSSESVGDSNLDYEPLSKNCYSKNLCEDNEDIDEISSLLTNIQFSTNNVTNDDSQEEILTILTNKKPRSSLSTINIKSRTFINTPFTLPNKIKMTGRVLHSDKNLKKIDTKILSMSAEAPRELREVPQRVSNPLIKNFTN